MKNLINRLRSRVLGHVSQSDEIEILPPLRQQKLRSPRRPSWQRTEAVMNVLNEAPQGTYEQKIEHVRRVTGRACSRKVVARWSKQNRKTA